MPLCERGTILSDMYEIFEHTADLGLRIRAADLPTLFADAGRGLTSIIAANLDEIRPVTEVPLRVTGGRLDLILFDWLSEILYLFESEHLLLAQFDVRFADDVLQATAHGEPLDEARHQLEHEVKAITYHGLKVEPTPDGWLAEVIVDI
ncbi:MAG TPA: archease [Pirellulales bacterium]|nr:archease [Pirellulales bacterium]